MSEAETIANAVHWIAIIIAKDCQSEEELTAQYLRLDKMIREELEKAYEQKATA